jgi:pimeloyl-ACP methyl ester carboxylesterase
MSESTAGLRQATCLASICLLALTGCAGMERQAEPKLVTESYMIDSADPGIQLFIRNKHPAGMTQFRSERTLLYVHGATQAASSTFDLELDGLSWMAYIAQHGYDVYLVDLRGYGRSSRPAEMEVPATENPPIVRTDVAVKDVEAAVNHILSRRQLNSLDVMGWSWGCAIMGRYAGQQKDKVHRLVLYAPDWVRDAATTSPQPPLGAYRTWNMADARKGLQSGAPPERKDELLSPERFAAWSAAETSTDPDGAKQVPPVVRTPNGIFADSQDYWMLGKALWEPSEVAAPTLVVVGEWDGVTPVTRAQVVFGRLVGTREKRFVQIGEGTHIVFLEKNRIQLFREVQSFLDE